MKVDHINNALLPSAAEAEVAAKSGHDIFFLFAPRPLEERRHTTNEIVQEVQRKVGKIGSRSSSDVQPEDEEVLRVSDNYVPDPVVRKTSGTGAAWPRTRGTTCARRRRS